MNPSDDPDATRSVDEEDLSATLAAPPLQPLPPGLEPKPGDQVGPYRLVAEIGQGGMGAVWRAERADGTLRRPVALKLPRLAWGGALAARLARERDILATLAHPNIARLYDAGVDEHGRPYLAMEYVEGQDIETWCREQALSVEARLQLLLQVAAAVAHAHARLVVHRDLKPANILVTAEGQVRLLDFGIAKLIEGTATQDTALTQLSGRVMTLNYASPEQIRGEPLGTASDVYSLGVVAYELLTGARPYRLKRASAAELEEAITQIDPPLASAAAEDAAWGRLLRGDLDAILNKALKKRVAERYDTVEAFAQDLQRHLRDEPVLARPDSAGYRAAKFIGRHRLQVAAGTLAALALVAGTGVALWQAHEARQQAERARTEAATATAVQNFIEAVFLASSGAQADPGKARDTTARELIDRGADRLTTELANQPAARLRLHTMLAGLYDEMGLYEKGLVQAKARLTLAQQLRGERSAETAVALAEVGYMLTTANRNEEAQQLLERADRLLAELGEPDFNARMQVDVSLCNLYWATDLPKGLALARTAAQRGRTRAPTKHLVSALQMQGELALRMTALPEARDALTEATKLVEAQPELGRSVLPMLYSTLGDAQSTLGERAAGEASFARALALAAGQRDTVPMTLHIASFKLARAQFDNGRLAESIATIRPAADWARSTGLTGGLGQSQAGFVAALGRAMVAHGDAEGGLAQIDHSLAMLQGQPVRPEHQGPLHAFRAVALAELGRGPESDSALARSWALIGDDKTKQARIVRAARRQVWLASGRAAEALADLDSTPIEPRDTHDPMAGVRREVERAVLLWASGQADAARDQARSALTKVEALPSRLQGRVAEAQASGVLGRALLREGAAAQALPLLERSAALHREVYDVARSLRLAAALRALAEARQALGDATGAARDRAEAGAIAARHPHGAPLPI